MDPRGLAPCSCPEATINTQGESRIPGRSREQKGKKRKSNAGKHSKGFKKRKEGVKKVLKNLDKHVSSLDNIIENQEKLTDKLLHRMTTVHLFLLPPEAFDQVLKEESAILFPDSDKSDVLMLETKRLSGIISPLKHRCEMVSKRINLLCEMTVLEW
ncbi:hypothetical protein SADUNF_Sadunf03G0116900 [Salix dunnii]|uniref:Uncharacterized protein n=1 Tax=Salix dunnii TaxID=1413687 RepID=A0A835TEE6_9ROSI|nr:hypothetical protein SADUNF_Sadunf03G0116900 [Salix dunnii]